jgi:2-(1,2-epoxy-1,2-dihydrophenyl)acetyl-CoA isomerase
MRYPRRGEMRMAYTTIEFDETDGVATLTLNRPAALNALTTELMSELIDAVDRVRDQATARCLLLTGSGRAFCSGADLASGPIGAGGSGLPDAGHRLETHFNPLLERLFALPIPFITAVNGPAAGAGCSFALAGDIVVASESAYFLQAFVNIGLVPDVGATWLLPRLAGRARAQAMMMLGEKIPAATARDWGMIWQVVPDADLPATAQALAARLAAGPTRAYGLIRQGIRDCLDTSLTEALAIERRNQRAAGRTADVAEGVAAFLQKRPAAFTGR